VKYGILTTVSRDREGLVAKYTDHLREWGANLIAGHGHTLGRTFVFDALFQMDDADWSKVSAGVAAGFGDSSAKLVEAAAPVAFRDPAAQHYTLTYIEEDSVGIVSTLAETLSANGASIVTLESETLSAPTTGVPVFRVKMELDVPTSAAVRSLREAFATLEKYKGWEIDFEPEARAGLHVPATAPYPPSAGATWAPSAAAPAEAPFADPPFADPPKWAVLSTLSADRPGIIAGCAKFLADRRANIHSQTARRIGDRFAAHFLFRAADDDLAAVRGEFAKELADFQPALVDSSKPSALGNELHLELTVHAMDEPGILAGLTKPITNYGASIVSLSFGVYPGTGVGGTPLFVVEMGLLVRDYIASRHIEAELLKLEKDRGWEIDYRPAKKEKPVA
jgi:glycine cleavage system regulatory protein